MSLHYLIKEPKIKLDTNPLLLLLHGYGSNEEDLFSFANELPDNYYIISVRAPYTLMQGSYAWYAINFDANQNKFSDLQQAQESRDLIADFITQITQKHPINPGDITLIGFSQGAILSYAIALSYPQKAQRVAAMSGYLEPEIATPLFKNNKIQSLQFFISHGTSDQVIPVDWARKAKPMLDLLQITTVYKEYPVGHGITPQNFYDLKNWLIQK